MLWGIWNGQYMQEKPQTCCNRRNFTWRSGQKFQAMSAAREHLCKSAVIHDFCWSRVEEYQKLTEEKSFLTTVTVSGRILLKASSLHWMYFILIASTVLPALLMQSQKRYLLNATHATEWKRKDNKAAHEYKSNIYCVMFWSIPASLFLDLLRKRTKEKKVIHIRRPNTVEHLQK